MPSKKIAVTDNEYVILQSLKDLGKTTPKAIAKHANLKEDQVISSKSWLITKKLIEVEEIKTSYYELTKEGAEYAEKGMPEFLLIKELKASKKDLLKNLQDKIDKQVIKIALKWAKDYKWIEMNKTDKGNEVLLTDQGEAILKDLKYDNEEILKIINENKSIKEEKLVHLLPNIKNINNIIDNLLKRKLINIRTSEDYQFSLKKDVDFNNLITDQISIVTKDIISSGSWKDSPIKPYNLKIEPPIIHPGKRHPYLDLLDEVREILIGMGFQEEKGPFVECEFYNFDALFQAQDHPAREIHDSYKLKTPTTANLNEDEYVKNVIQTHLNGWETGSRGWGSFDFENSKRLVLRSQTTSVSMRTINKYRKPPIRMFSIDKVFRPDVLDAKHAIEFHQVEGIVLDEGLTFRHLLGILSQFAREFGFDKVKFKPGYFPFTEPSVEAFAKHEKLGWIEILGSGLFRPEVLLPFGIDYPRVQCLAWGIGIGRLAMIRLGIDDIRELHSQNLEYLRNAIMI
ncbi:MAG: phenylalanine--tRNA ligase subunit alpha [Candidatus Lokiarchaeota archaeon]|nr:phenylalanine--tRNA ligase subunit alpha [Candidatus Lokiarchaeota archaeon]